MGENEQGSYTLLYYYGSILVHTRGITKGWVNYSDHTQEHFGVAVAFQPLRGMRKRGQGKATKSSTKTPT
jgi:hypothetical protein